jgi:hypothetical protein
MRGSRRGWVTGIERDVDDDFTAYKVLNGICAGV